jgi:YD repeat-containing protein
VVGNSLVGNTWYDASGNTIKTLPAGSNAFTKTVFDSVNRPTWRYAGYYTGSGGEPYSEVGEATSSNIILEQLLTTYDAASNIIEVDSYQRFDPGNTSDTAGGALNYPTGSDPKARASYAAAWFDGVGRQAAAANYGTNGNTPISRPSTPPSSGSAVLVSLVTFNLRGEAYQTTDPMGTVTQTARDNAGRRIQLIENYVSGGTNPDQNRSTAWSYNGDGNVIAITACNAITGNQTTSLQFGVSTPNSTINRNDLLHIVTYADGGTVAHEYNRQGQRIQTIDQNGTVHQFAYDMLGRQTADQVKMLGEGIDGAIMAIALAYDVRSLPITVSSLNPFGAVVNQVQRVYNGFRQLTAEYQEHGGAVSTGITPLVQYGYADGSANTIRPISLTYPNDNVLGYSYGAPGGMDDNLSRITALNWTGGAATQHTYLGLGTIVRLDNQQPGVRYDLITGSGVNPYAGLDQFGRVVESLWYRYSGAPAAVDQFDYGYDLASNRLWRQNALVTSAPYFDELYAYDGLYQLKDMQRGQLNGSQTAIVSGTLAFHETWGLDPTGNWGSYTQDATGAGTPTLAQSRDANRVNEITEIAATVGPGWIVPQYDPAGNMTRLPQPLNPSAGYTATWDAWNRLVTLTDGQTTVEQNSYDGLNRRIARGSNSLDWDATSLDWETFTLSEWEGFTLDEWESFSLVAETPWSGMAAAGPTLSYRHYYYSAGWQVLEERTAPAPTVAGRQFVWGLRYIDELILRDRSVNGVLNERLYALQDDNWNVTSLCDTAGNIQERYAYSAYGVVQFLDADFSLSAGDISAYSWETLYGGYRYDAAVGLYLAGFRWLNPPVGCSMPSEPVAPGGRSLIEMREKPVASPPAEWPPGMMPNPETPSRSSLITGTYQFWVPIPPGPQRSPMLPFGVCTSANLTIDVVLMQTPIQYSGFSCHFVSDSTVRQGVLDAIRAQGFPKAYGRSSACGPNECCCSFKSVMENVVILFSITATKSGCTATVPLAALITGVASLGYCAKPPCAIDLPPTVFPPIIIPIGDINLGDV